MATNIASIQGILARELKSSISPLTATKLQKLSTIFFNHPLTQEQARYYLTELNDKPALKALFNLTITILMNCDAGRENVGLAANPIQALINFCQEHLLTLAPI